MANIDKVSADAEIDYQYPDENIESETDFDFEQDVASEKPPGFLSRMPKKKLITFAFIGIVLFAVYQVLSPQDEEEARVPQAVVVEQPEQPVVEQPVAKVAEPNVEAPIVQEQPTISLAPVQVNTGDSAQVSQLQTQFQGVSNEVVELKQTLSALIKALEVLASQVQDLRQAQQLRPATFMPFKPEVTYFLKAVVPGRAWLESTTGELITVKQGDAIPEYGTINKIDHNEGWVETSSGLIIGYGRNDS
jgi:intracellular multiplication protein IcmG